MLPDPQICERARLARDPRFDGRFIVGVLTTGIFCRPICPARLPAEENVRYFATPASAQGAGFRPCLRCRPEAARRLPEWTLNSQTVIRGMRMIDAGFLDDHSVDALAGRLSISLRHLNRLFVDELGATPKNLAKVRRVQLAKRLIDQSNLSFADLALRSGYGSVRRFNDEIRNTYGRSPRELRRGKRNAKEVVPALQLPVREPYNEDWVFDFLRLRALPGIEEVSGDGRDEPLTYRRRLISSTGSAGCEDDAGCGEAGDWLSVRYQDGHLVVELPGTSVLGLGELLCRIRRIFDLDADPGVIGDVLSGDPLLKGQVVSDPGLRVPGAWDGFETAVRAILGQQVSVARATDLAGKLCRQFGGGVFPSPAQLVEADVAAVGMPGTRGAAIRQIARAVVDGELVLDESAALEELTEALCAMPGIGPWTAGYIGMRVVKDPDAFVDSDWVVLKVLDARPGEARKRAEAWRPWRSYAVMYLWRMAQLQKRGSNQSAPISQ